MIGIGLPNSSDVSAGGELIPLKNVIIHPDYVDGSVSGRYDFGIVVLEYPTSMPTDFITLNRNDNVPKEGVTSIVMGWGQTEFSYTSDTLLEVDVTPIGNEECKHMLGSFLVYDDMVCALDKSVGKPACFIFLNLTVSIRFPSIIDWCIFLSFCLF